MTILNDIRACLDSHLVATTGIPSVYQDNVDFEPETGVPFLRSSFVPTLRRPATRGLNPVQRYDGIYSILICTPQGQGSGAGLDLADLLLSRFDSTTDLVYYNPTDTILLENGDTLLQENNSSLLLGSPTFVSIEYSEVGLSYLSKPYYCTPVSVAWYLYA